jgi:hypothetical protein
VGTTILVNSILKILIAKQVRVALFRAYGRGGAAVIRKYRTGGEDRDASPLAHRTSVRLAGSGGPSCL